MLTGRLDHNLPFVMDNILWWDFLMGRSNGFNLIYSMKWGWGGGGLSEAKTKKMGLLWCGEEMQNRRRAGGWRLSILTQGASNATRLWRFDISAGKQKTVATYSKPGLVAFPFQLLCPGLKHEARARAASFPGNYPQLCGFGFCRVSCHHQLLVWGDQEGAQTLLLRTAYENETVVLHPLQQFKPQRQPAGAIYLWDRRGKVYSEEVPYWNIFLLWAGCWYER